MASPAHVQTRRRGLPKTRSGCRTCKVRRVKCGEEKPYCLRCTRFGIKCDGYGPSATETKSAAKKTKVLLPKEDKRTPENATLLPEHSFSLFSTEQDHRYFDIFCTKTAFEILPSFDSGTLRQILLQSCVSEPSIRHAVVALGALDLTAESLGDFRTLYLDDQKENPHQHHKAALRQYATAIKEMREASLRGNQDITTTLLTCLVILCFEAWNGNQDLAVRQIQTGLRLIQAWREDIMIDRQRQGRTDNPCNSVRVVDDALIETFSKLDVQAISFAEESTPERHTIVLNAEQTLLDNMPLVFQDIKQAEVYENAIIRQGMRFFARQVPLSKPPPPKRAFPVNAWWGMTDPEVVSIQRTIINYITTWTSAFSPLYTNLQTSENQDEPTFLIAYTLSMHIKTLFIALLTVCSPTELIFDLHTSTFSSIVALASLTLKILNKNSSSEIKLTPKFSFDSQVVIPLHMVAHKSRDRNIRREAIGLLMRYPRREGVWDSVLGARIGGWALAVEEEFCDVDGKVPGWARIHGVVFERDLERRGALLSCEQRIGPGSEEVVVRRKIITW